MKLLCTKTFTTLSGVNFIAGFGYEAYASHEDFFLLSKEEVTKTIALNKAFVTIQESTKTLCKSFFLKDDVLTATSQAAKLRTGISKKDTVLKHIDLIHQTLGKLNQLTDSLNIESVSPQEQEVKELYVPKEYFIILE